MVGRCVLTVKLRDGCLTTTELVAIHSIEKEPAFEAFGQWLFRFIFDNIDRARMRAADQAVLDIQFFFKT